MQEPDDPIATDDHEDEGGPGDWMVGPRGAVLLILASVVLIGGGRRLLLAARARRAIDRLGDPDVTPDEVLRAADHGRAGLPDLFRLLTEGRTPELREAAGRALSRIWAADDLIPEEEQAVVRRGFACRWRARRRYPRAMTAPIPVEVHYGLPFLESAGAGIGPADLEWSHRITGAERASLEASSPWTPGDGLASFAIDPGDFPTNGPHRLVLIPRVRTASSLTSRWEIELPHVPFSFEFDPRLERTALETLPDDGKRDAIARSVSLEPPTATRPRRTPLPPDRRRLRRPRPAVDWSSGSPLPSDLAHRIDLEVEGVPGLHPAGQVVATAERNGRCPPGRVDRPARPARRHDRPTRDRIGSARSSVPTRTSAGPTPTSAPSGRASSRPTGERSGSSAADPGRMTPRIIRRAGGCCPGCSAQGGPCPRLPLRHPL